jgi:hypothetical protein
MTVQEKIADIIDVLIEWKMIDPIQALYDKEYLAYAVKLYIESAKKAEEIMRLSNMPL